MSHLSLSMEEVPRLWSTLVRERYQLPSPYGPLGFSSLAVPLPLGGAEASTPVWAPAFPSTQPPVHHSSNHLSGKGLLDTGPHCSQDPHFCPLFSWLLSFLFLSTLSSSHPLRTPSTVSSRLAFGKIRMSHQNSSSFRVQPSTVP